MDQSRQQPRIAIGGGMIFVAIGLALFARLALFPAGPGADRTSPDPPRDPAALIASPNDPLMIKAIEVARSAAKPGKGSNAWSSSSGGGATISFKTVGGSIALTREEIAEANFIYPQFVSRAKAGQVLIGSVSSRDSSSNDGSPGSWGSTE